MKANVKGKAVQAVAPDPWAGCKAAYRKGKELTKIFEEMREEAIKAAMTQAYAQSGDVAARTLNEVWIAMDQAGLSKRKILQVRKIYQNTVLQRTEDWRKNGEGDAFCEDYLTSRDLPYERCELRT